jgi:2Fe-2S ferredoxin
MGTIRVNNQRGNTHLLAAIEGWRVMEANRSHGLPIDAICGGACVCPSCHVHVARELSDQLHPARDDEEGMLASVAGAAPSSRLSSQIIWMST